MMVNGDLIKWPSLRFLARLESVCGKRLKSCVASLSQIRRFQSLSLILRKLFAWLGLGPRGSVHVPNRG